MPVGNFNLPITGDYWTPPSEWIDISSVGNNEINMLVMDDYAVKFTTTVASSGKYDIDWGDGTVETGRDSGTAYTHQYALGSGTTTSYGYTVYKIRIYNATNNITNLTFQIPTTADVGRARTIYNNPLLWIVYGTNGLTSFSYPYRPSGSSMQVRSLEAVYMPSVLTGITTFEGAFQNCSALQTVKGLSSTWGSCTTTVSMFQGCTRIRDITLPSTLPNNITNMSDMFNACNQLRTVNFPSSSPTSCSNMNQVFLNCVSITELPEFSFTNSVNTAGGFVQGCVSLKKFKVNSWGTSIVTVGSFFSGCINIEEIDIPVLPATVTALTNMFQNCNNLTKITNVSFGSATSTGAILVGCSSLKEVTFPNTTGTTLSTINLFSNSVSMRKANNLRYLGIGSAGAGANITIAESPNGMPFLTDITLDTYLSKFSYFGSATNQSFLSSLRLLQTGSTYTGTSPQINISNGNLGQAELVQVFNDLPTLTSKTINITNNPGAALLTPAERAIATGKGWTITG